MSSAEVVKCKEVEVDKELTFNEKLQLFLIGFESALWRKCQACGNYHKQDWSPQEWADKLEELIN